MVRRSSSRWAGSGERFAASNRCQKIRLFVHRVPITSGRRPEDCSEKITGDGRMVHREFQWELPRKAASSVPAMPSAGKRHACRRTPKIRR